MKKFEGRRLESCGRTEEEENRKVDKGGRENKRREMGNKIIKEHLSL
jgi:hypothetical protein